MIIIDENTEPTDLIQRETIGIYTFFGIKNVESYTHIDYKAWNIQTFTNTSETINYCLAIDTIHQDAFGHWVFECAIYLELFNVLKKRHSELKLYLKSAKCYKKLFYEYFGLTDEDVIYEFDVTKSSMCYFPSPISALNYTRLHPDFVKHVDAFWGNFKCDETINKYTLTVMPRQTKENYKGNDRRYPLDFVKSYASEIPNSIILNTDTINELKTQINVLRESKIIVITDGSPLLVNGMFCYDKDIFVNGLIHAQCHLDIQRKLVYIIDKIKCQNKSLSFIASEKETTDKITELLVL